MIKFPTDNITQFPYPPQFDAQKIGGAEKYGTLDGSYINVLNIGSASITSLNAGVINAGTLSADRIGANSITASKLNVSQLSAITADMGTLTAGTITGGNIFSSSSSTKIHLDNGDYIRFYAGGNEKARIRGSTARSGGIVQEIGDYFLANNKSYCIAETNGSNFGRWGVNNSNQMIIVLPTATDQFFIKDHTETTNLFTVSNSQTYSERDLQTNSNLIWYDSKLAGGRSRYVFKDTGGTERFSITPDASPNTKLEMNGHSLRLTSDKTAIMPTSKGYRALYTLESPEIWFMDFCPGKRFLNMKSGWKFWKWYWDWTFKPDPTFMEVTEAPYVIMKTGHKDVVQVWAKRKGKAGIRFDEKTEEEFKKNEAFWNQAKVE